MKVRVDQEICIGTANCVAVAPAVFELDNRGLSAVVDPSAGTEAELREAAEECPVQAIILEAEDGQRIYP